MFLKDGANLIPLGSKCCYDQHWFLHLFGWLISNWFNMQQAFSVSHSNFSSGPPDLSMRVPAFAEPRIEVKVFTSNLQPRYSSF